MKFRLGACITSAALIGLSPRTKHRKDRSMITRFALATGLALILGSPSFSETYENPDQRWWGKFFQAVEGAQPDFEALAKKDPEYLAASEFTRAEVLKNVIARLKEEQAEFDVPETEVKVAFGAKFGDYSSENGGFPVNLFAQNMHMRLGFNKLFFRNWDDYNIFPATIEQGKEIRARTSQGQIAAEVTMTNFRKSETRPNAYNAFITKVAYFAPDGLPLGEFTAVEDAALSPDAATSMVADARATIIEKAGIPELGTSWADAKGMLIQSYPYAASDDFAYLDSGKKVAFRVDEGAIVTDAEHEAGRTFRVFLQQVDGPWRKTTGFSGSSVLAGMNSFYSVDIKGTGPGLACYTPEKNDRCAVLEFSPTEGGHVLTRAYGVIELDRAASTEAAVESLVGAEAAGAFNGFTAKLGYDPIALKNGAAAQYEDSGGVAAYVAGAGETREGEPFYDPLENTRGVNPIKREIALFAVEGAENRTPIIFVLQ
ncbi:hypothetical protein [Marivita sp. GX14005]|uniref:hypothetical protein n=1 Tax=Marivita sp. GX14005 TaxID=2942276 RepID=UPI002018CA8F|nr:hypothetical protein [Marivita sp. GX14005]MCL3881908.1 hypothetical protein [Marivita sp. GX14005]